MQIDNFSFECVMLVDDTKIDRYVAQYAMKKHGFARNVIEFDMATKAIDYLEKNHDRPDKLPEVILLDVRMPEMDGFQFLERLSLLPSVKKCCCIIMISSSLDPHDHGRAEKNEVVKQFMNKPLNQEKLESIVTLYNQV